MTVERCLVCPYCGGSLQPLMRHIGSGDQWTDEFDGMCCDTCPGEWDERGIVTRYGEAINNAETAKAQALDKYLQELDRDIATAKPENVGQRWHLTRLEMERERWDRRIDAER